MGAPWSKYGAAEQPGPWSKYGAAPPPIPGTEKLGLPGPARDPNANAVQRDLSTTGRLPGESTVDYLQRRERAASDPSLREMEQDRAAGRQVVEGIKTAATSTDPERMAHGASQAIRGGMHFGKAVIPFVGPIAPVATVAGLGAGMAAQYGTEKGLEAVGVPEGYRELAGDVAGLAAGGASAKKIAGYTPPVKYEGGAPGRVSAGDVLGIVKDVAMMKARPTPTRIMSLGAKVAKIADWLGKKNAEGPSAELDPYANPPVRDPYTRPAQPAQPEAAPVAQGRGAGPEVERAEPAAAPSAPAPGDHYGPKADIGPGAQLIGEEAYRALSAEDRALVDMAAKAQQNTAAAQPVGPRQPADAAPEVAPQAASPSYNESNGLSQNLGPQTAGPRETFAEQLAREIREETARKRTEAPPPPENGGGPKTSPAAPPAVVEPPKAVPVNGSAAAAPAPALEQPVQASQSPATLAEMLRDEMLASGTIDAAQAVQPVSPTVRPAENPVTPIMRDLSPEMRTEAAKANYRAQQEGAPAADPGQVYEAAARQNKADALAKALHEGGITAADAKRMHPDHWDMLSKALDKKPPSVKTIKEAVAALERMESEAPKSAPEAAPPAPVEAPTVERGNPPESVKPAMSEAEYNERRFDLGMAIRDRKAVTDADFEFLKPDDLAAFRKLQHEYRPRPQPAAKPIEVIESGKSGFERVKGDFDSLTPSDDYLYHVTTPAAARRILSTGLQPGSGSPAMGEGFYRDYSRGKVFLSDAGGVSYWQEKIGGHLEHQGKRRNLVVLRIPRSAVEGLAEDTLGSKDSTRPSFYSTSPVGRTKSPLL